MKEAATGEHSLEYNLMDLVPTFISENEGVYTLDKRNLGEFEVADFCSSTEHLEKLLRIRSEDVCPHCGRYINIKH